MEDTKYITFPITQSRYIEMSLTNYQRIYGKKTIKTLYLYNAEYLPVIIQRKKNRSSSRIGSAKQFYFICF